MTRSTSLRTATATCTALQIDRRGNARSSAERHHHDFHQLVVCLSGDTDLTWWTEDLGQLRFRARRQDIILNPAGITHSFRPCGPWDRILINVDRRLVSAAAEELGFGDDAIHSTCSVHDAMLFHVAATLSHKKEDDLLASDLYAETIGNLVAIHMVNICRTQHVDSTSPTLTNRQLKTIDDYVIAHLDEAISVESLARLVGLGTLSLTRRMRVRSGLSPYQYVTKLRVSRACDMLATTGLPIAEVALAVGFSGQSHFSSRFKQIVGLTPRRYRNERS